MLKLALSGRLKSAHRSFAGCLTEAPRICGVYEIEERVTA